MDGDGAVAATRGRGSRTMTKCGAGLWRAHVAEGISGR